VKGGPTATLTFDANGNMTADGSGNSYSWDAENRLIKITYPGSGNYSQFAYDGLGRNVLIQEYTASSLTGTRQFVWTENNYRKEARDASSTITGQYFTLGETISSMGYCFTADHVANPTDLASRFDQLRGGMGVIFSPLFTSSIREMINSSGTVEAQLAYDMYGRATQLQGSLSPDFQFGDYYFHSRSGLSLTLTRAYSSAQGRFINRDAIAERDGLNLYEYVHNHPEQGVDPSGTCVVAVPVVVVAGPEAAVAAGALGAAAIAQAAVLGNTIGGIVNNAMNSGSGGFGGSGATNPWEWNPAHVCPAKPPQDPCDPPVFQPGMTLSKCLMYCTGCSGWKRAGCDIKCRTFLWGN
jgi:RHS repeat-associated protein